MNSIKIILILSLQEIMILTITINLYEISKFMKNDNIYVRKLDSIMKLPLIDEIISDKTGTITKNIMIVKKIQVEDKIFDSQET